MKTAHTELILIASFTLVALGDRANADTAHDKYSVLDVKIGQAIERSGFTCTKQAADSDSHCVKFLDSRCSGQPTNIGVLRYRQKAPAGCFYDPSSDATYLDSVLMQTPNTGDTSDKSPRRKPLQRIALTGTQSKPSKVYEISYTVPLDELTEDSKLYGALVKKYGEPIDKRPPGEMRWSMDNTKLKATCGLDYCEIRVNDSNFEDLERHKQGDSDAKQRHKNAPDAPPL